MEWSTLILEGVQISKLTTTSGKHTPLLLQLIDGATHLSPFHPSGLQTQMKRQGVLKHQNKGALLTESQNMWGDHGKNLEHHQVY